MEHCGTFQKFHMFWLWLWNFNGTAGIRELLELSIKFYDWSTLSSASELVTNFWNLEVSTIHKPKPPLPGTESSALWYKLLFRSYPGVIQYTAACFGFRATLSLGPVARRLVPTGVERWVECCRGGFGKCHGESWMLMEWRWMNNGQNTLWKDLVYKS